MWFEQGNYSEESAVKVLLKKGLIVLVAETDAEQGVLAAWRPAHSGHVFYAREVTADASVSLVLSDLGERLEACREPINVVSASADPRARIVSNFAETPFLLDGDRYLSVESFWQGLKFPLTEDRARVAAMTGPQAQSVGRGQSYPAMIDFQGARITPGGPDHWRLMEMACRAKFAQNADARTALLATGSRPLIHRVRRESRTIPGVVMADIWMRIRRGLRRDQDAAAGEAPESDIRSAPP